ncbi:MAG: lipase family alpha/beta hydrolase, partial [Anaerolineales bacterium]
KVRAEGDADACVRFVTHSMGGLVLRSALGLRGRSPFQDVGRIVFIAPPFQGSCDIPKVLVAGERGGWLSSEEDFRKLARSFPAVYELIPSFRRAAVDSATGAEVDLFDYRNWQRNVVQQTGTERDKLQPGLLADAEAFRRGRRAQHGGASAAPLLTDGQLRRHADQIAILLSVGDETPYRIPVVAGNTQNPNWFDFDNQLTDDHGDLRVHLKSAAVRGITLAAYRGIKSHALVCRENIVIKSAAAWLQGNRLLKMRPRRPRHTVGRSGRDYFDPWNGRTGSLKDHIVDV